MKIIEWNIGSLYSDYSRNIKTLEEQIGSSGAEIVCLQECVNVEEVVNRIMECGSFEDCFFSGYALSHVSVGNMMGLAVFSKSKIVPVSTLELAAPDMDVYYNGKRERFHKKAFITVKTQINDIEYLVITGHGFPFYRYGLDDRYDLITEAYRSLNPYIGSVLDSTDKEYALFCADFNLEDITPFVPVLGQRCFDIFFGESTRPSGRKTDAVFLMNGKTWKNKRKTDCGFDHYMLEIEI